MGDGTNHDSHTPVEVVSGEPLVINPFIHFTVPVAGNFLRGVKTIAASLGSSYAVLAADGSVQAWGSNVFGALGIGATSPGTSLKPVRVTNVSGVTAIAAREAFALAARSNATVQAWGSNSGVGGGQLGDGTTIDRPYAVQVENLVEHLSEVTAIAAGVSHSLAAGPPLNTLTVREILMHPDVHHLQLFNLKIDGVVVGANINGGSTAPHAVSIGNHTVSETAGGMNTDLGAFGVVIGGDCAPDGTVNLALGDNKTCTITNFDHFGGCPFHSQCCDGGDGTQQCKKCSAECQ